ncbi:MAG: hypothetical protein V4736_16315 [Bdellovibrionota bacterium]
MLKAQFLLGLIVLISAFSVPTYFAEAEEEHGKDSHVETAGEHKEDAHDESGHKDAGHAKGEPKDGVHKEEGHEEEGSAVGPDKGITEKGEDGFKLAPEAIKTIGIVEQKVTGSNLTLPSKAVVKIKYSKSVFRVRNGWYKRVPVVVESKQQKSWTVSSDELQIGDLVVVEGSGYLRVAEILLVEGASHSH